MLIEQSTELKQLQQIIQTYLVPYVEKIDQEALYADAYLRKLGEAGLFSHINKSKTETMLEKIVIVQETAKVCMTTAFCVWCHLAAITYVTNSKNAHLQQHILPKLMNGELISGTGLSNPLKAFSNLESIQLKATKVDGGYRINGKLPAVSNIGKHHAFAFIANVHDEIPIMLFTHCHVDGLTLKEKKNFVGLNGSATFSCQLQDVFVPEENVISFDAIDYVQQVRSEFVSYQIPLGLGVTLASIEAMNSTLAENNEINKNIRMQPHTLEARYQALYSDFTRLIKNNDFDWEKILHVRLEVAYLTLDAVQAGMIHSGGAGYVRFSPAARRLREAYFIVNLTPTIKHLETILPTSESIS